MSWEVISQIILKFHFKLKYAAQNDASNTEKLGFSGRYAWWCTDNKSIYMTTPGIPVKSVKKKK